MKCTELLKLKIINNEVIQNDEFEDLIFRDVVLFAWKQIDFQSDMFMWISNQTKHIKSLIEQSVISLSRSTLNQGSLTKTGVNNFCNYIQSILNLLGSACKVVKFCCPSEIPVAC